MTKRRIWIVEMYAELRWPYGPNGWGPTVGGGLTRDDARKVMKTWRQRNPSDKFRLICYMATR